MNLPRWLVTFERCYYPLHKEPVKEDRSIIVQAADIEIAIKEACKLQPSFPRIHEPYSGVSVPTPVRAIQLDSDSRVVWDVYDMLRRSLPNEEAFRLYELAICLASYMREIDS